jgi:hypothetical protein
MIRTSIDWLLEQLTSNKDLYDDNGYSKPEEFVKVIDQAKNMHAIEMKEAFMRSVAVFEDLVNQCKELSKYDQLKEGTDE